MTAHHIFTGTELTTGRRKPSEIVAEYEAKRAALADAYAAFRAAGDALKSAATVGGTWGNVTLCTGRVYERQIEDSLLKSAWRHVYQLYGLAEIATAQDKRRIEIMFENPPAFTVENIRDQFGAYVMDPWGSILRGLAEVFGGLDPAFKSHEKMKIGVKGLPKRVILHGFGGFIGGRYHSGGMDRVRDILNALAAYQGKPLVEYQDLAILERDGDALRTGGMRPDPFQSKREREREPRDVPVIGRGVWLKTFHNGNGHLFFEPETLRDVNRALAEFYGEVLPDCPEADEDRRPATGRTMPAKDLQFYPTPRAVIDRALSDFRDMAGLSVLEPSCGDGRIMDALREKGVRRADMIGVEIDPRRTEAASWKGHAVVRMNFLDIAPEDVSQHHLGFDLVVMNPPFYGKHYAKHVRHALDFVKPGGKLIAILPSTARYDHGLLDDLNPHWEDLPVGAFAESGTNVCTSIATIRRKEAANV